MKIKSIGVTLFLLLFLHSYFWGASANDYATEAQANFKKGKYNEAIALYRKANTIHPKRDWFYQIGNCYYRLNDFSNAAATFVLSAKYNGLPKFHILYYDTACAYSRAGDADNAEKYLLLALENGYTGYDHALIDGDLEYLRHNRPSVRGKIWDYKNRAQGIHIPE